MSVAVINIPWLDLSWPYKVFRLAFPIVAEEKMENTSTPAISWLFLWLIDWRQRLTSNLTLNPDSLQWQQNQNRSDTGRLQLQLSQRDQSQKLRNFNNSQKETFPKGGRGKGESRAIVTVVAPFKNYGSVNVERGATPKELPKMAMPISVWQQNAKGGEWDEVSGGGGNVYGG